MAIRQQGKLNFLALVNYTWLKENFDLFQNYLLNSLQEVQNAKWSPGIIYGGVITPVAGLTVQVSKGLALFSDGTFVTWDNQNVVLSAADPANPRYDRIELSYALNNNSNVNSNDTPPVVLVLDKIWVGTAVPNTGAPAASPAAPATTAGRISVGIIHVAATQTVLGAGDISQIEDTAKQISYSLLGDSPYGVRFNQRLGVLQVTKDGVNWTDVSTAGGAAIAFANSPYAALRSASLVQCDCTLGAIEVDLPSVAGILGEEFTVVKTDAGANAVTIKPNGAELINGAASQTLNNQWDVLVFKALATGWVIK